MTSPSKVMWFTLIFIVLQYQFSWIRSQLPNVYDLTWFESFSLQDYNGLLNYFGSSSETDSTKMAHTYDGQGGSRLNSENNFWNEDTRLLDSMNLFKRTEENVKSADGSSDDGGHFYGHSVQQSDRHS